MFPSFLIPGGDNIIESFRDCRIMMQGVRESERMRNFNNVYRVRARVCVAGSYGVKWGG
jgi:hypothetical protein